MENNQEGEGPQQDQISSRDLENQFVDTDKKEPLVFEDEKKQAPFMGHQNPKLSDIVSRSHSLNSYGTNFEGQKFMPSPSNLSGSIQISMKSRKDAKLLNTSLMLNANVLGTEMIIQNMLHSLGLDSFNDQEVQLWNLQDNERGEEERQNISYLKMKNEMLHRQAMKINSQGNVEPISIINSSTGIHSSKPKNRVSELEQLGPGINLYFKMLKYYACFFFVFTMISLPSICIYSSGQAFTNDSVSASEFIKTISSYSLGNLNQYEFLRCGHTKIQENTQMQLSCDQDHDGRGYVMKDLRNFGLAFKEQTCNGLGMEMKVQTIERCSLYTMQSQSNRDFILKKFKDECINKKSCNLQIEIEQFFDASCQQEIQTRLKGNMAYGPPKLFGLAHCEQSDISVFGENGIQISRESASMLVVVLDVLIVFIFCISIFRLRWYEQLYERDRQLAKPAIEDFSVYMPSIPIPSKDYQGNQDLLTAMIATNLEKILIEKFMRDHNKEFDDAADIAQVSQIHYGLKQHHSMKYLVKIAKAVKKIAVIKKKVHYDPLNTHKYESQLWKIYNKITLHKEKYYELKLQGPKNEVLGAFITFRDIQARNKLLDLYKETNVQKFLQMIGVKKFQPKDMMLINKGSYSFIPAVDPVTVTWENLGTPDKERKIRHCTMYGTTILIFILSFFGIWAFQLFEKLNNNWYLGDCKGNSIYTLSEAYDDYMLPRARQQGLMGCYCSQMYTKYGEKSLDIRFKDNYKYCQDWYVSFSFADYINYFFCLYLAVGNWTLQQVFNKVGKKRNTENESDNYEYRLVTIFICQYFNTAIMYLWAYHSFFADPRIRTQNLYSQLFVGPFDEYSTRWYLVVGTPLVFTITILGYLPNVTVAFQALKMFVKRFHDRGYTMNNRKTRQITQEEYEDIYTGPEFFLQIRLSQILAQIFIAFTFSCGMPLLYLVTFISFCLTYYIDKALLLRYYRKQNKFNPNLSARVVNLLPWAVVAHFWVGFVMYTSPGILKSKVVGSYGNTSQYWNYQRVSQSHAVFFFWTGFVIILLLIFEVQITAWFLKALKMLKKSKDEDSIIDAPDLYYELDFLQLCSDFKILKTQRIKYQKLRESRKFSDMDLVNYINPYIQILDRNAKDLIERIKQLTDSHIDRCPGFTGHMTDETRLNAVKKLYINAIDKDNANRNQIHLDREMYGRIANVVKGYDLMDNQKYKDIKILLENLKEDFDNNDSEMENFLKKINTFQQVSAIRQMSTMRENEFPEFPTEQARNQSVKTVKNLNLLEPSEDTEKAESIQKSLETENKQQVDTEILDRNDERNVETEIELDSEQRTQYNNKVTHKINANSLEGVSENTYAFDNQNASMLDNRIGQDSSVSDHTVNLLIEAASQKRNSPLVSPKKMSSTQQSFHPKKKRSSMGSPKLSPKFNKKESTKSFASSSVRYSIKDKKSMMNTTFMGFGRHSKSSNSEGGLKIVDENPKKAVFSKKRSPAKSPKKTEMNKTSQEFLDRCKSSFDEIMGRRSPPSDSMKTSPKQAMQNKWTISSKRSEITMRAPPSKMVSQPPRNTMHQISNRTFKKKTSAPKFSPRTMQTFMKGYTEAKFNVRNFQETLAQAKEKMMQKKIKNTIQNIKNLHVHHRDIEKSQFQLSQQIGSNTSLEQNSSRNLGGPFGSKKVIMKTTMFEIPSRSTSPKALYVSNEPEPQPPQLSKLEIEARNLRQLFHDRSITRIMGNHKSSKKELTFYSHTPSKNLQRPQLSDLENTHSLEQLK